LWGLDRKRLDVIHLGTSFRNERIFASGSSELCSESHDLPDEPYILSLFNLEPRKNLRSLLQAFAIAEIPKNTKLVLFGRAGVTLEREQSFRTFTKELGLCDRIWLTDFVSDEQVRCLLSQTLLFVFPSLYEGFGYPVLEAMAAGACVVTRHSSSMSEIVDGAGVLVETSEPVALAEAIGSLVKDSNRRDALRRSAASRAREFCVEKMARKTWESYRLALNK
jgi:glycosyltransferase involved in cell wall biosynthesis